MIERTHTIKVDDCPPVADHTRGIKIGDQWIVLVFPEYLSRSEIDRLAERIGDVEVAYHCGYDDGVSDTNLGYIHT